MKNINLGKQYPRLAKAARNKLAAISNPAVRHMVYGISRSSLGRLSTFFVPMTDEELELYAYGPDAPDEIIYCEHR